MTLFDQPKNERLTSFIQKKKQCQNSSLKSQHSMSREAIQSDELLEFKNQFFVRFLRKEAKHTGAFDVARTAT